MDNDIELVDIQPEDIETIRVWRNSDEVRKHMYTSDIITSEQQKLWFERISASLDSKYWMIKLGNSNIGVAYLNKINYKFETCSWSFYIGDTSVQGSGLSYKVLFNVLNHAFDNLGLNKVIGEVIEQNGKSIKIHETLGFKREGYYREHIKKDGQYLNVIGFAILKSEWTQARESVVARIYNNER